MNEFINELILSKGKNCLIFVVTDSVRDLIERMGSNDIEINEIRITSSENPLETLVRWKDSDENTVFAVYGMKSAFPEILGYLNLHRDLFYDIKRPVVIMGSDYEITEIARYAPDFWRFRRSTYDFTEKKEKGLFAPSLPEPKYFLPSIRMIEDDDTIRERMQIDEHLLRVVKEDYKKAELYMSLAISHCKLKNFDKGKEYLENSIEIKRKLNDKIGISINYLNFGDLHDYKEDFDEAIRYYDEALKLNPDLTEAYFGRGLAYDDKKVYSKAIEDYNRVIERYPDYADAYTNRGVTFSELNELEKAIEDFSKAIEINPNLAEAYANRGVAFVELNELDRAIEDFSKAIEINPNSAVAYYNRGITYSWLNQYEKAIKDFNSALGLNPNDTTMMTILSENYILNKEYKNARKTAEKILSITEDDNNKILSHFFVICSLLLQKKIENAKQEIDKLMTLLKETEHWKITFNFQNLAQSIADSDTDMETNATLTSLIDLLENKINLNQFSSSYSNN